MTTLTIEYQESAVVARERIAMPKTPDETVKAITDILNADNYHDDATPPPLRVRKLIRQRVEAQQKLVEQIRRNAELRAEIAVLRGGVNAP